DLQLARSAVTGTGFAGWRGTALSRLTISPNATDAGARGLAELNGLRVLWIAGPGLSDDGAKALRTLNLEELGVYSAGLTDAALDSLLELKELATLKLGETNKLTDEAVKKVAKFPKLTFLGLSGDWVTDDGLAHLRGTGLRAVSLWPRAPRVTDSS